MTVPISGANHFQPRLLVDWHHAPASRARKAAGYENHQNPRNFHQAKPAVSQMNMLATET